MLNVRFNSEKPCLDDNIIPQFSASYVKEFKIEIRDDNGKLVETRIEKRPFTKVLSSSDFENEDLPCELFSVENMKKAGVDLFKQSPTPVKLFGLSLEDRSAVAEHLDNFDYSQLTESDFDGKN